MQNNLFKKFWEESAQLINEYRRDGDERAAQGVVSCRILFSRLEQEFAKEENETIDFGDVGWYLPRKGNIE